MKKQIADCKTDITIHDDTSDKHKDSVVVEEVADNEPGGDLII